LIFAEDQVVFFSSGIVAQIMREGAQFALRLGRSYTSTIKHKSDGRKASDALTFKPDHPIVYVSAICKGLIFHDHNS